MSIPADIPPGLASLVRRCLSREPSERPDFPTILAEVQALKDRIFSRPPSQESGRPEVASPQAGQRASGRPRQPLPPPPQLSAEEREQHKAKQRQLIKEQEEWLQRQLDPAGAAARKETSPPGVVVPARAPSLPSPFAAALAPAPSLASPFAAAPERAPSLPQPAGAP